MTVPSQVVANPRISAGSTVDVTGSAAAPTRTSISDSKNEGIVM